MRRILDVNEGDVIGDYVCTGKKIRRQKSGYNSTFYVMKCQKCGRIKEMLSSTLRLQKGTTHKSCGRGLKTKDPIFYQRWQVMRTRTTNHNYAHADRYVDRGISSKEFENFIDFYDAMYDSYVELSNKIGRENTSLERIDINKDYTVTNCKWIDVHEQQANTCRTVKFIAIFPDGHREECDSVRRFAKEHDLDYETILDVMSEKSTTTHHKHYRFIRL